MRRISAIACAVTVVGAVVGCGSGQGDSAAASDVAASGSTPTASPSQVDEALAKMSTREKVRQLVWPSVDSLDPRSAAALVRRTRPGGLIIMPPGNAAQWRAVVRAAQRAAAKEGLPPLLIAADQENGTLVRRMRMPVAMPGAMVLGAAVAGDDQRGMQAAEDVAGMTGRWLRSAGVTVDFAPVADVNVRPANPVIGIRSPGAFPAVVGDTVVGQVRGFDAAATISTAKHFPGHGDTATDSHLGLAKVTHSKRKMQRIDLPPFQDAIDAGIPAIMVAHVTVPAYDSKPASVSRRIVTGLLRNTMGFDGLVVTDSLGMGAVASRPNLAVEVVRAGGDVLLMPNSPTSAASQVLGAVKQGQVSRQRLDDAARHVLQAKEEAGLLQDAPGYPAPPSKEDSRKAARGAAAAGLTVLGSCRVLVGKGATVVGSGEVAAGLRAGLRDAGVKPGGTRIAVQSSPPAGATIWVATGSPYSALRGGARQRVLTYGDVWSSGWAAGQALAGKAEHLGGLPVRGPSPCTRIR